MPVEQREAEWWKQINQSSAQQKRGVVPRKGCSRPDEISPALRGYLLASGRKKESGSRAVGRRSLPEVRWTLARAESGHHLESPAGAGEIRLSGLGGGVASSIATPTSSRKSSFRLHPGFRETLSSAHEVPRFTRNDNAVNARRLDRRISRSIAGAGMWERLPACATL